MLHKIIIVFLLLAAAVFPQALFLVSPKGGETFNLGDSMTIQWDGDPLLWPKSWHPEYLYVSISYSVDNGQTWKIISSAQFPGKICKWMIPYCITNNNNILVKVAQQDIDNPVSDISKPFSFREASGPSDAYEPNDDFSSATPITLGDTVVRNAVILPKDEAGAYQDVDFFKVNLDAGKLMTISVVQGTWLNGDLAEGLNIDLYDASKNNLAHAQVGDGYSLAFNIAQTGDYYVRVTPGNCGRKYGLSISQGAGTITLNSPSGGESFSAGQQIPIRWTASPANLITHSKYSLDSGASWSDCGVALGNENTYLWTPPQSKKTNNRVLIKVIMNNPMDDQTPLASDVSSGTFTILGMPADTYEPNDDFASAASLSLGDSVVKNASVIGGDTAKGEADRDFYKVTLVAGKKVIIRLTNSEPDIVLYDSTKKQIASVLGQQNYNTQLTCDVTQTGVYYCRIAQRFSGNASKYCLSIFQDSGNVTIVYPNGGEVFSAGEAVTIRWTKDPSVDLVWLDFSSDNGSDASWKTIGQPTQALPFSGTSYTWTVPYAMTNRAKISVRATTLPNAHDVSDGTFSVVTKNADAYEPNNGFASAYPIAIGDSVVKNAMVIASADIPIDPINTDTLNSDIDFFKVSLPAGKLVRISTIPWGPDSGAGPTYGVSYPLIMLYDTSKNVMSRGASFISCNILQSGVYYCKIMPIVSGGWNAYGLSINSFSILSTQKSNLDTAAFQKTGDTYITQIIADTTRLNIALTLNKKIQGTLTTMTLAQDELSFAPDTKVKVKAISIVAGDTVLASSIKTADITIPYSVAELNGNSQNSLTVRWLNESTNQWTPIESNIDTVKHIVVAHTTHFSIYGVFVPSNTAIGPVSPKLALAFGIKANFLPKINNIAVHFSLPKIVNADLRLYNTQGKCVRKCTTTAALGASTLIWNLGALANGKYFLNMKAGTYQAKEAILIMN